MKSLVFGSLLLVASQSHAMVFIVPQSSEVFKDTVSSVEQKVIEIHMTRPEKATTEESKYKKVKKQTLPLEEYGTCSGEFVSAHGDILTAKHCVEGFSSFEIIDIDINRYVGTVTSTSSTHDLALLHIDKRNTPYFDLADSSKKGDHISVFGSPLGITGVKTEGYIAKTGGDAALIDCGVLPGNSGGPVVNDAGELVGVVNAGFIVLFGTTHLNTIQGLDAVYFFLKSAGIE